MPGLGDTPDAFFDHGFVHDAVRASDRCDLVAVDAHLGYYTSGTLRERIGRDVLLVAHARGYREIWMVGISLGGLGSLLVARDQPELVDGVVLLAPYLGDERIVRSVIDAGGLGRWQPPEVRQPTSVSQYTAALWSWLRGYVDRPSEMPALYLGYGTEDRLAPAARALAAVMPPSHVLTTSGGHDWGTWRILWRSLLARPPWGG
jgi:pimeloyl-ACP methyl ester carboxylesterase